MSGVLNEIEEIDNKSKMIDSDGLSVSSVENISTQEKIEKEKKILLSDEERNNNIEDKIVHYKKLLRAAGVFIRNYEKFFDGCKSERQKIEKIKNKIKEIGHEENRITLQSCIRLKKENDRKAELEELSQNVILPERQRPKRNKKHIITTIDSEENSDIENENSSDDEFKYSSNSSDDDVDDSDNQIEDSENELYKKSKNRKRRAVQSESESELESEGMKESRESEESEKSLEFEKSEDDESQKSVSVIFDASKDVSECSDS